MTILDQRVVDFAAMPYRVFGSMTVIDRGDGTQGLRLKQPLDYAAAGRFQSVTFLLHDPQFIAHYFHFVEILLAVYVFHRTCMPGVRIERFVVSSPVWSNPRQNDVQRQLMTAVYPDTPVVNLSDFTGTVWENVILVDRTLAVTAINKFLEPVLPLAGPAITALAGEVWRHVGVQPKPVPAAGTAPRALYVSRRPPRSLSPDLETRLLDGLRDHGVAVDVVDYAGLSWSEQVAATASCDLLVGVHGNGLTNLLWLPPHAGVIEIFPAGAHHYDYQVLSELRNLAYVGVEGCAGGYIFREFSRYGGAYGHGGDNNREIGDLAWNGLALNLRHLLQRWRADATAAHG